ncbi:hypothetical protein BU17DRAFT_73235 [Hysterangium stoloniferum]|nr:hypothetical protein BU17DRAFT_73235 [Hysterangium stoloniferum]
METDLRCNNLSCRKILIERAVVVIDCANALFDTAQVCSACEAPLNEPDDVVITSLRPTNDYKTSVLSGLSPAVVLEICGREVPGTVAMFHTPMINFRAIAFWQYQIHQEGSYQQAVLKSLNDKNSQISKQLENVVREANGEINLLNNKLSGLERELELERRKARDAQASSREKDKEYQKLKVCPSSAIDGPLEREADD